MAILCGVNPSAEQFKPGGDQFEAELCRDVAQHAFVLRVLEFDHPA